MLRLFGPNCSPEPVDPAERESIPTDAIWVDLLNPTRQEERLAEALIGQNIPTREEMLEIEPSSRLYERDDATVMTMSVVYGMKDKEPGSAGVDPVSFILTDKHLVTLRYVDPAPFVTFSQHVYAEPEIATGPLDVLLLLLDAIVDRLADRIEEVIEEIENISEQVFEREARAQRRQTELRYEVLMLRIGAVQRVMTRIREASVSATRMLSFLAASDRVPDGSDAERHVKSLISDLRALNDHSNFVGENLTFLLDASLGMITLRQNLVMKIFSIVAVVLMPPTLIAGLYGMNFEHMPELRSVFGYPAALAAMLASAVIPYWIARKKGWL